MSRKIKVFLRLHWIKILLILIGLVIITAAAIVSIMGLREFLTLESFYKRMQLSTFPFQILFFIVNAFIFALIINIFHYWFFFGGGIAKLGQKQVKSQKVNVTWKDVVGMESIKGEVWEVIQLIKDRAQLKRVGGKIIKGVLMVGPPGCGKTYLAKAIATEAKVPFLSSVGSEFMGIFVGLGSNRIRSLFKQARALSELHGGCIIFIDEIDTIARPRVGVSGFGAGMDYNATINQLLTEMDGLKQVDDNIVVVAATNVSENELDPALMRAGRFDRKIYVGRPSLDERKELFRYYLDKLSHDEAINIDVLARRTVYFSAADIANMVRESSLIAVRKKRDRVVKEDLSEAYDRVVFGLRANIKLSEQDKRWTAYHEAGHAIVAYHTHPTDDVIKATIIPRKGLLGYAGHRPREEVFTEDRERLIAHIKTSLGGYVAEKLKFGRTSSGVEQDFRQASFIAYTMVWRWGMGSSGMVGNYDMAGYFSSPSGKSNGSFTSYIPLSEKTKQKLDEDVQEILSGCLKEVEELLTKERNLLDEFARRLFEKEELEYDEITQLFQEYGKQKPAPGNVSS